MIIFKEIYLKKVKNKLILDKIKKLEISIKELSFLLKEDVKTIKSILNGEITISKKIIEKLNKIPNKPPLAFQGKEKFKMIDLFAGIGGIRLGFQKEGGRCVFSSEWNEKSALSYRLNYGDSCFGDITKIEASQIPDFDVLLAGFPCQAFSQAGLKRGFEDTRGTLFFEIARIIKEKKPKSFLLENVRGLISHDKGNTFDIILKTLNELGYAVYHQVLTSVDFGVPQNRKRIIIVGFLKEKVPNHKEFKFPIPMNKKVKVGDILEDNKIVDPKYTLSNKLWEGHKKRKKNHEKKGNGFGYSLFDKNSPYTNTISARYYKDGSEALIDQSDIGKNPRKLTPRECARLQGFPENFLIPVSDVEAYKQFGNSVTMPLMNAVAKEIIKIIND